MDFSKFAPYLKDPLVLVGFVVFVGFLFAKRLLASGIIPPVGAGRGAAIIRLLMHYGFIIGLLIVLLGFGLKYQELSESEQRAAAGIMRSELEHNAYVAGELAKNSETLFNAAMAVAGVVRMDRLKINFGLFAADNIDPSKPQNADLYNQRFEWLQTSGLLDDPEELRRFREQNAAVVRSIDRTLETVKSLGDRKAARYVINRNAYDANLPVLRKMTIFEPQRFSSLYARTAEVRETYFRVAESVEQYLVAMRAYCAFSSPDRDALGAVLAAERLTARLLPAVKADLDSVAGKTLAEAQALQLVAVN